jgi:sec-independent protein translocase protein TatC
MSLMEHLKELRNRILICMLAVALGAVVGWFLFHPVLDFLSRPLEQVCRDKCLQGMGGDGQFLINDPLLPLTFQIRIATYLAIGLAMPVILWQLWRFIAPGLYSNERRYAVLFVAPAFFLFLSGAAVAYVTFPLALQWLQSLGDGSYIYAYSPEKYVMLIAWMMIAFGAAFEFPMVLVSLSLMNLLSARTLRKQWRYAIVIIFLIAAVITPSADPFTFLFLALPMCLFYVVSIAIAMLIERRRARRTA